MSFKVLRLYFILTLSITILSSKCPPDREVGEVKDPKNLLRYNLTIYTAGKRIAVENSPVNKLKNFIYPIEDKKNKNFFLPDKSSCLVSLDSPIIKKLIYCNEPLNEQQRQMDVIDYDKMKQKIDDYFDDSSFNSLNVMHAVKNIKKKLKSELDEKENKKIYAYFSDKNDSLPLDISNYGVEVFYHMDSLYFAIQKSIIEEYSKEFEYVILYDLDFSIENDIIIDSSEFENNKLYSFNLNAGNRLYVKQLYKNAKRYFEAALKYRPNDKIALDRIRLCNEAIKTGVPSKYGSEVKYNKFISLGNREFAKGNYTLAREYYEKAQENYDDDGVVKTLISSCIEKIEKAKCPENVSFTVDFDNDLGVLNCVSNHENGSYRYILLISDDKDGFVNLSNILGSEDLFQNSKYPNTLKHKKTIKKFQEIAELYFKYEIYCGDKVYYSKVFGPLKYGCKDTKECQLMRYQN